MKKSMLLIGILSVGLVGCSPSVNEMQVRNDERESIFIVKEELADFNFLVEDKNTGCYYIQSQSTSMYYHYSPYYDQNGKIQGCKGN